MPDVTGWRLSWPRAWGDSLGQGVLRMTPEDFDVTEVLGAPLDGEGEHLCLYLEKRGDSTEFVADSLARLIGVPAWQVGFCGLKDRHALTRQWFSLTLAKARERDFLAQVGARWRVLEVSRHRQKLRRGQHVGNRFKVRIHLPDAPRAALAARVALIAAQGCPNYFGEQRFGREGSNLERALRLKAQHLRRKQPRDGMALSAMRSWLFNEYLGERVEAGNWRDVLEGDPALRGVPTGPLFGDGGTSAAGAQGAAEQAVLERHPVFKALFDAGRMPPDRRDLVLYPKDLCIEWQDDYLCVQTFLPSGAFLTTLLAELIDFSSGAISLQEAATGAGQDVQGSPDEVVTGK